MSGNLQRWLIDNPEHVELLRQKAEELRLQQVVISSPEDAAGARMNEADRINALRGPDEDEVDREEWARTAERTVKMGGAVLVISGHSNLIGELGSYYRRLKRGLS